jgi:hypothetical protein
MENILLIILVLASIWDAFTTVYGTVTILGGGPIQIAAALLFSALILGFVLSTRRILRWRTGFTGMLLKFFWFVAICFDFYTSWVANTDLIVGERNTTAQLWILVGLTVLVTGSPIVLSALWERRFPKAEQEREQVREYS